MKEKETNNYYYSLLENIIQHLQPLDKNKRIYCGSLYNLFESPLFDIHLLFTYLDRAENQGIIDNLVNIMYKKFENESDNYILQIWYYYLFLSTIYALKKYDDSLENFILDKCINQMKFSLKVSIIHQ